VTAVINQHNARKMQAMVKASGLTVGNAAKAWEVSRAAVYTWKNGEFFPTAATLESVRAWFEGKRKPYDLEWFVPGPAFVSGSCGQTSAPNPAASAGNAGAVSGEAAQ
jgi:hypothetical protein